MSVLDNITVPKIIKKLNLADYSSGFKNMSVRVWVNPSQTVLDDYAVFQADIKRLSDQLRITNYKLINRLILHPARVRRINRELKAVNERIWSWYSHIWSQHQNLETHISAEQVRDFAVEVVKDDPALWRWLTSRSQALIVAHQENLEKN